MIAGDFNVNALPGAPRENSLLNPSDFGRSSEFDYLTTTLDESLPERGQGLKDLMRESKMSLPASTLLSEVEQGKELLLKSCNRQYVISTVSDEHPIPDRVVKDYMHSAATFYSWLDLVKFIRTKQYYEHATTPRVRVATSKGAWPAAISALMCAVKFSASGADDSWPPNRF